MKRIICFILSIILSVLFIIEGVFITDSFLRSKLNSETFYGALLLSLLVMCFLILIIEVLNSLFDKADEYHSKKRLFGRWAHNCTFITLIVCFAYGLFVSADSGILQRSNTDIMYILIILMAVGGSVCLYGYNYRNLLSRKTRVDLIKNREVRYKDRRFYYLVEEIKESQMWMKLEGTLNGKMCINDEVHIYIPCEETIVTRIRKISADGRSVKKARDGHVEIYVKKDASTEMIQKYSVVSSVVQTVSTSRENNVENPFVNGLVIGYTKFHHDPEYMSALLWQIGKGEYLMGGRSVESIDCEVTDAIHGNINASFPSVSANIDEKSAILPVFTDWDAMQHWKMLMADKDAISIIMKFEQIVDIMHRGFDGVVINPFGPSPFFLPNDLADSLKNMKEEAEDEE